MLLEPEILEHNVADAPVPSAYYRLRIAPALEHFVGHYPGLPILPGVVQVDWSMRLARAAFGWQATEIRAVEHLKFLSLVQPGAVLELNLRYEPDSLKLHFSYTRDGQAISAGRFVLSQAPEPA